MGSAAQGGAGPGAGKAAGSLLTAYAQIQAGQTEGSLYDYNAAISQRQARDSRERTAVDVGRIYERAAEIRGQQITALGYGNVASDSGSAAAAVAETARRARIDATTRVNNGLLEQWGLDTQAAQSKYQGKMARREGYFNAIGTVLGSAG